MKKVLRTTLVTVTILFNVTACTYIKSLFPDKEKDYQYTTEIAPLIIPEDLKHNSTPSLNGESVAKSEPTTEPQSRSEAVITPAPAEPITTSNTSTSNDSNITVNDNEAPEKLVIIEKQNEIELNSPLARSWRLINKAMTRKAIEVIARNQQTNVFTVHFDPDEQKPEDDSYWHLATSMFENFNLSKDIHYVKLQETNQKSTTVVITDQQEKPLSDANSSLLLKTIKESLKEDLNEQ